MRYAVPVNAAEEVAALAAAGAGELYVGYQDRWWVERYGDHDSMSRRQGRANLSTRGELAEVVDAAHTRGLLIWLALNSRYTEPQLDHLTELCEGFERMGGTGVIASDLGLLWRLSEGFGLARCLSILAVAQNAATLAAYARLGVSRVVLPRFMEPKEAKALLSQSPGMEGEFMAFFDKCPWVDGYCRRRHGVTYLDREVPAGGDDAPELYTFDTTYRSHACLGRACTYLEPYPCAACHLSAFDEAGAHVAKLGGRGRPLDERLRALRFLHEAEAMGSDAERERLFHTTFGCACTCYYGAKAQDRRAIEPVSPPSWISNGTVAGSQTDPAGLHGVVADLLEGKLDGRHPTLLVPPLSQGDLAWLLEVLPELCRACPNVLTLVVNDLGTLVSLTGIRQADSTCTGLEIELGTLLARSDDPREVAHFLSPTENPPRAIWGPDGEPRTLVYREPPATLARHWEHPSLFEPSAQAALRELTENAVSG